MPKISHIIIDKLRIINLTKGKYEHNKKTLH